MDVALADTTMLPPLDVDQLWHFMYMKFPQALGIHHYLLVFLSTMRMFSIIETRYIVSVQDLGACMDTETKQYAWNTAD